VLGPGKLQADLGLKDQALILDLDLLGRDRSLKLLRGMHGEVLRWRWGGVPDGDGPSRGSETW
jgi:hypothetical protein